MSIFMEMSRLIEIQFWKIFSLIILIATLLRFYIVFGSGLPEFITDTYKYFEMADAILSGKPFSAFPNGYPMIVALTAYGFGWETVPRMLLILNVAMGSATVAAAMLISKRIAGTLAAMICGILICFWPNQLNFTRQLLSETPATFFLIFGILGVYSGPAFLAGMMFWCAAFIRSMLLPVAPLVAVILLLAGQRQRALWLMLGFAVGVGAETILSIVGVIVPSNNLGPNLLISIGSDSIGGVIFSTAQFSAAEKASPVATYFSFALHHPVEFLYQRAAALWELWGPWPSPGDPEAPRSFATRLIIGLRFPLLLLALTALYQHRRMSEYFVLAAPIIVITGIHIVFFSSPRFTFTIEPFAIILAAMSLDQIINARKIKSS